MFKAIWSGTIQNCFVAHLMGWTVSFLISLGWPMQFLFIPHDKSVELICCADEATLSRHNNHDAPLFLPAEIAPGLPT